MEFNSISEFKKNFAQKYKDEVIPKLKYVDNERLCRKKKADTFSFWCNITIIVTIIIYLIFCSNKHCDFIWGIGVTIAGILGSISYKTGKDFENKLKQFVMPNLMKAFGNLTWSNKELFTEYDIRDTKIFPKFDNMYTDDNFSGTYRGVPINISETLLTITTYRNHRTRNEKIFKGVLISIGVGKNFTGHTVVREREIFSNTRAYEEVKLEDPEFQKRYFVDSNDQIEARYLLTPAFMERFKHISTAFGSYQSQCSFKDGKIMIALSCLDDIFKLGDLKTPVTDSKPYQKLLAEIISIFEMIDHLKLLDKTGL